jgi:hypothetical protein
MVEAGPVTAYLRIEHLTGASVGLASELLVSAALVIFICLSATIVPLRIALRTIEKMEW